MNNAAVETFKTIAKNRNRLLVRLAINKEVF